MLVLLRATGALDVARESSADIVNAPIYFAEIMCGRLFADTLFMHHVPAIGAS